MTPNTLLRAALCGALCLAPVAGAVAGVVAASVPGWITGLSADGKTAVGSTDGDFQTFRWTPRGGVQLLGRATIEALGTRSGTPRISGDGQVISATILSDDGSYATIGRWTAAAGWQQVAQPLPSDAGMLFPEDASIYGMSRDGSVITGLYWRAGFTGGSAHALRWSAATGSAGLGSDGGSSRADGVSADGRVVVGWDEHPSGSRRATVWVDGVKTVLDPSDWPSEASAVSADGRVVVGYSADTSNNFRTSATMWTWTGSTWQRQVLGAIDGPRSQGAAYASAVSDDGRTVVGVARPNAQKPDSVGFVWTADGGLQDVKTFLQSAGARLNPLYKLINVTSMSADGRSFGVTAARIGAYEIRSFVFRLTDGTAAP